MQDLRKQFWTTILEMAKVDKDIIVLVGDLGFSFVEKFQKELPDQFINCGIAENNMIGVACGLAITGKKPYIYSNTIFLIMRAYEFVRDDICYNNLNVKLIGTGASGFLGFSHNILNNENAEDLLKNLPNIKSQYPKNENELNKVLLNKNNYPEFIQI